MSLFPLGAVRLAVFVAAQCWLGKDTSDETLELASGCDLRSHKPSGSHAGPAALHLGESADERGGAKNGYIFLVAAVVPFVLAIILALGVGYFFAGFQGFTWSVPGVMAYGGGFAVEAVCLACFFAAAKAFWGGVRWHFVAALVAALLLSTISIAAQILYLDLDALKGAAQITPGALDGVPIIGWLVGTNGGGWVVLGRAIGFHVAEAACCFVLAKSTENPEKRMLAMQREQRALLELQRFERIAALERRIFEHAFAAFDQIEQQLSAPVQVNALPVRSIASPLAPRKGKQEHPKAITAEFQTLAPVETDQGAESEDAPGGNGKRPFPGEC